VGLNEMILVNAKYQQNNDFETGEDFDFSADRLKENTRKNQDKSSNSDYLVSYLNT